MLASIHPLGERARHNRFWVTTTAYIAGSVAGGAVAGGIAGAMGAALWAITSPSPVVVAWLAVVVCLCGRAARCIGETSSRGETAGRRRLAAPLPRLGLWRRLRISTGTRCGDDRHNRRGLRHLCLGCSHRVGAQRIVVGAIFGAARASTPSRFVPGERPWRAASAPPPPDRGRPICPHRHHWSPSPPSRTDRDLVTAMQIDSERIRIDLPTGWEGEVYRTTRRAPGRRHQPRRPPCRNLPTSRRARRLRRRSRRDDAAPTTSSSLSSNSSRPRRPRRSSPPTAPTTWTRTTSRPRRCSG